MQNTKIVAFTGLMTCGKTTAAKHLVEQRGYRRLSFAQPIRAMLTALGLTEEQLTANKNEPVPLLGGKTPRYAMQTLGTEWGRDLIDPNLWARALEQRIRAEWSHGNPVVLDDCRFDNEAHLIERLGGPVIEITRPGLVRGSHPSEAGVSETFVNYTIRNDSTVKALTDAVDAIISHPAVS